MPPRRPDGRSRGRRRLVALLAVVAVAGAVPALLLWRGDDHSHAATRVTSALNPPTASTAAGAVTKRPAPLRVVDRPLGELPAPLQDAAASAVSRGQLLLAGGLTAADTSTTEVSVVSARGSRPRGSLPGALHDAAAVTIGAGVYLFGGGNGVAQLDSIARIDPGSGRVAVVGRLPAPASDLAAAAIGSTAYVVGGYTGTRWLDTILSWHPGARPQVVARLPQPLRYAAVATAGGRLVIAGGSLQSGDASSAVLVFDPGTRRVRRIGDLPSATTHAAAAALNGRVYVIGGRGATIGTPTRRVTAVDPLRARIRPAGRLDQPLSDLAAGAMGGRILLAGGRTSTGAVSSVSELVPVGTPSPRPAATSSQTSNAANVYAHDQAGMLSPAVRRDPARVYVPNSESNTVDVIDPRTYRVVAHFAVGALPQHVIPAHDLKTLYVANDLGNSLTPIDPRTGRPGKPIPVDDPYNLYFTPSGRYAIVVAERLHRLDFRDARTFALRRSVPVPCVGVNHMDFSADGRYAIASCEFSGQLLKVDIARKRVVGTLRLPRSASVPQDVRLAPDGRLFYVADLAAGGVWKIDGRRFKVAGFVPTGAGAHGLVVSRDARYLYVANRNAGSVSVISFRRRRVVRTWTLRGGGSPDMGGVSADGRVLWLSGRFDSSVYAIDTRTGKLLARIPVGSSPHGVCVWPQPGRYSLGHVDNLR